MISRSLGEWDPFCLGTGNKERWGDESPDGGRIDFRVLAIGSPPREHGCSIWKGIQCMGGGSVIGTTGALRHPKASSPRWFILLRPPLGIVHLTFFYTPGAQGTSLSMSQDALEFVGNMSSYGRGPGVGSL